MQWWRDWKPHKWVDVQFALEQFSGAEGNKDGILFIYYTFNDEKKVISHPLWYQKCSYVAFNPCLAHIYFLFTGTKWTKY